MESVTSNSFSARLFADTLIWMLIFGCCCCGAREEGAFGFSNDRSLVYCARTFSWGGACSGGAPLPLVMKLTPETWRAQPGFRLNSLDGQKSLFRASGYHSPASFHKDDGGLRRTGAAPKCGGYP